MMSFSPWNLLGGAALVGAALIVSLIAIAALVITYVLTSMGIMNMAKARGHASPNLAWIPIVKYFLLGQLVPGDEITAFGTMKIKPVGVLFLVLNVVSALLGRVTVLGVLVNIALGLFVFFVFQKLYEHDFDNATVIAVLIAAVPIISAVMPSSVSWISSILSLVMPVTLFIAGRKELENAGRPPLL